MKTIYRVQLWLRDTTLIIENQMEKKEENEMDTLIIHQL